MQNGVTGCGRTHGSLGIGKQGEKPAVPALPGVLEAVAALTVILESGSGAKGRIRRKPLRKTASPIVAALTVVLEVVTTLPGAS